MGIDAASVIRGPTNLSLRASVHVLPPFPNLLVSAMAVDHLDDRALFEPAARYPLLPFEDALVFGNVADTVAAVCCFKCSVDDEQSSPGLKAH